MLCDVDRPLLLFWPGLRGRVHLTPVADVPTPVQPLDSLATMLGQPTGSLWCKRDDLTSPLYGGNKVRTLEVFFGLAQRTRARRICATGAFGSNHALATVLHAPRAALHPEVILFPQPHSPAALENLQATLAHCSDLQALRHWVQLPWATWRRTRRSPRSVVMPPGGATALGTFGCISAGLEVAQQVHHHALPAPRRIVIPVGSGCTSAGLLVGTYHAAARRFGFIRPPVIHAVRVTPWPVTSRLRIVDLAVRASRLLAQLAGDPSLELRHRQLLPQLRVNADQLGAGYGHPTADGIAAARLFCHAAQLRLDTTYSAKAAAAWLSRAVEQGPSLFWCTKSSAPLPGVEQNLTRATPLIRRWLAATSDQSLDGAPNP